MKGPFLLESHFKNCWCVDVWSDGTIEMFSIYKRVPNVTHRLTSDNVLDGIKLPEYVIEMVHEAREVYRAYLWDRNLAKHIKLIRESGL